MAEQPGPTPGATPPAGGAVPPPTGAAPEKAPPRPIEDVVRDLERERGGLVDALDQLKLEAKSLKARLFARRNLAIAGGGLVALFVLRRWLKSRRRRSKSVEHESSD